MGCRFQGSLVWIGSLSILQTYLVDKKNRQSFWKIGFPFCRPTYRCGQRLRDMYQNTCRPVNRSHLYRLWSEWFPKAKVQEHRGFPDHLHGGTIRGQNTPCFITCSQPLRTFQYKITIYREYMPGIETGNTAAEPGQQSDTQTLYASYCFYCRIATIRSFVISDQSGR